MFLTQGLQKVCPQVRVIGYNNVCKQIGQSNSYYINGLISQFNTQFAIINNHYLLEKNTLLSNIMSKRRLLNRIEREFFISNYYTKILVTHFFKGSYY